jgi:type VI secretion system protein ImpH
MGAAEPSITDQSIDALQDASLLALALAIERAFPEAPAIGEADTPARESVRFRAHPGLGFADAEVRSIEPAAGGRGPLTVFQTVIGLHGPSSPLPPYFTERVIATDGAEGALAHFLDFFNHRLAGLLVRVWKQRRHHLRYRVGALDPLSVRALTLAGLPPGLPSDGLSTPRLLSVLGLLALSNRSAGSLAAIVSVYAGVACRVEEFHERIVEIPPADRALLGQSGCGLGEDFVIGDRLVDHLGAFRLVLGPVNRQNLDALLPTSPLRRTIDDLVAFAVREPLDCKVAVEIARGQAPDWSLGEGRLGWTTWLSPDPNVTSVVFL